MDFDKNDGPAADGSRARDPRLHDPPKPVVRSEVRSELAQKIAKLSQHLSTEDAGRAVSPGRPTAPALVTSGSLNEARAYLPHVAPATPEEPITIEMHRVRVADEVNAVTWVTERIERKPPLPGPSGSTGPDGAGLAPDGVGVADEATQWAQGRSRRRMVAILAAFSVVLGAVGLASFTLVWRPARARSVMTAQAAKLVPPGLMDQVAALYEQTTSAEEPAPTARGLWESLPKAVTMPKIGRPGPPVLVGGRKGIGKLKEEAEPPKKAPQEELILP
jgi:hypothetical protein